MMKSTNLILFVSLMTAFGCSSVTDPSPEHATVLTVLPVMEGDIQIFGDPLESEQSNLGQWEIRNGSKICHGYLTRVEDEDFCTETIPEDWLSFTYDGQTYYVQPLAGS